MKRPSFQFYPGDWLQDAALRACSVEARGVWVDLLCLMHQGSDYGYLKVNHKPILPANLARMLGATLPDVERWIAELEMFGVFSRDEDGCIMSRRMIRDEEVRQARAAGGFLGGNPALKGKKKVADKVKDKVNHQPNLEPTPSSPSTSPSSTSPNGEGEPPAQPPEKPSQRGVQKPEGVTDQTWSDWLQLRKSKKAPVTETVLAGARSEAAKADLILEDFLQIWCTRGSQGLQADWIKPNERLRAGKSTHAGFAKVNYREGINDDGSFS